jgi:magnesium transporter
VIISTLDRLATVQMTSGELETLRTLKNTINDFGSQVKRPEHTYTWLNHYSHLHLNSCSQVEGIRRVLTELLDNEEDLHLLYLTMVSKGYYRRL